MIIPAMGTVRPSVEINLRPLTEGKVIWTSKNLIEGGIVRKGEIIVKIDPRDYELILITRKSELQKALYELRVEEGQQDIAKREWQILGQDADATELETELTLRKPHLDQKKAALESAKASVNIARLNLERTVVRAPFNGIIRSGGVHAGDLATASTNLAVIAGTDTYQLILPVPVDRLKWMKIPGSPVKALSVSGKTYNGRLIRIFSDLEEEGRMARVIAEIKNPLGLRSGRGRNNSSLLIGEFINAEISGARLAGIIKLPASAVHDSNTIWVLKDGMLDIENIEVLWRDSDYIYAAGKKLTGDLITSSISAPVKGMRLKTIAGGENTEPDNSSSGKRR